MRQVIRTSATLMILAGLLSAGIIPVTAEVRPGWNNRETAKKPKSRGAKGSVSGTVVHGRSKKGVAGASVHLAHHRHRHHTHHATTTSTTTKTKSKSKATHKHRHGVKSGAGGAFTLKSVESGSHVVVAHKKGVGSGHANVSVKQGSAASVTIRLHKHHHHHTTTTVTKIKK